MPRHVGTWNPWPCISGQLHGRVDPKPRCRRGKQTNSRWPFPCASKNLPLHQRSGAHGFAHGLLCTAGISKQASRERYWSHGSTLFRYQQRVSMGKSNVTKAFFDDSEGIMEPAENKAGGHGRGRSLSEDHESTRGRSRSTNSHRSPSIRG